ncbi:MAG: hypothetical protein ABMA64_13305 [Myxococcota bacterium]
MIAAWWVAGCGRERPEPFSVSPDGAFAAYSHREWGSALQVAMPGGGSDAPVWVEVVRLADGKRCGWVYVEIGWMTVDLTWSPGEAEIPLAGAWDLTTCALGWSRR